MKTKFGAAPFESLCFQDPAQHCRRAESPTRFPWFHVHRDICDRTPSRVDRAAPFPSGQLCVPAGENLSRGI